MPSLNRLLGLPVLFLATGMLASPVSLADQPETHQLDARQEAAAAPTAPQTWTHPGVLVSAAQLDFVKSKVASRTAPWSTAFDAMLSDSLLKNNPTPEPRAIVACGSSSSNPDEGCHEERDDALVAYANALAWWITRQQSYADKAIKFLNAWGSTFKGHSNDSASSNTPLQAGWSGTGWARAAEIMAHSGSSWAAADISKFKQMLRNAFVPHLYNGSTSNGNWELVIVEALQAIAVFLEDASLYNRAMALFTPRVPAYVYLRSDGDYPKAAHGKGSDRASVVQYWQGQDQFLADGIAQETCRDFVHTGYGLESIAHVAETSRHQGTDLYGGDVGTRLRYGLGFHSGFATGNVNVPDWLCNGSLDKQQPGNFGPITEVGYNALAFRNGASMSNTKQWTESKRPAGQNGLFVGWETLTHAMQPN